MVQTGSFGVSERNIGYHLPLTAVQSRGGAAAGCWAVLRQKQDAAGYYTQLSIDVRCGGFGGPIGCGSVTVLSARRRRTSMFSSSTLPTLRLFLPTKISPYQYFVHSIVSACCHVTSTPRIVARSDIFYARIYTSTWTTTSLMREKCCF